MMAAAKRRAISASPRHDHLDISLLQAWLNPPAQDRINMGSPEQYALLVCVNCRTRKKKCNKVLPSCGYCVQKGLDCRYASTSPKGHSPGPSSGSSFLLTESLPEVASLGPTVDRAAVDMSVYLQARRFIQSTGQFIDVLSSRYFQGIHRHLPIISRKRFHDQLFHIGAFPPPGFSILLLTVCLLTYHPKSLPQSTPPVGRGSLYLSVKSLFSQVQTLAPISVNLIQAGILLALYEYANGRPDDAFLSIAACARMGYASCLHHESLTAFPTSDDEEAASTWWGVVICERLYFYEISTKDQPLATSMPRYVQLPTAIEHNGQGNNASALPAGATSIEMTGLQHSAHAVWLSDQVLEAVKHQAINTQLLRLETLDNSLQSFLVVVMERSKGVWGVFCGPIAMAIRTMFMLHWHILSQPLKLDRSLDEWRKKSHDALDTVTKMVVDIADSHENMAPHLIDALPPSCDYIIQAALKHISDSPGLKSDHEFQDISKRLKASLNQFSHRWVD